MNSKHRRSKLCYIFHDNLKHSTKCSNHFSTKELWMQTRVEIIISTEETSVGKMKKKDFSEDKKKKERGKICPQDILLYKDSRLS